MGRFDAGLQAAIGQTKFDRCLGWCLVNTVDKVTVFIGNEGITALKWLFWIQRLKAQSQFTQSALLAA